jgi:hypothetical protein
MFSLGIPVMLVSFALGMMAYSVYDSIELASAITVIVGVILSFTPMKRGGRASEGFEDAAAAAAKNDTPPAASTAPATSNSEKKEASPAPAKQEPIVLPTAGGGTTETAAKDKSGFRDIKAATPSTLTSGSEAAPAAAGGAAIATPAGQFKLGEIPKDEKGGFFIDQGTTLMNALNGLKPDQIKSMTQDTRQLLETQKSLMGMLDSLAPMMKESSSLLNMFQTMFGASPTGAPAATSLK